MKNSNSKPWYESNTLKLLAGQILIEIAGVLYGEISIKVAIGLILTSIAGVLIRGKTNTAITFKK